MPKLIVLFLTLVLWAPCAFAELRIFINVRTKGHESGSAADVFGDALKGRLVEELMKRYGCSALLGNDDLAALLSHERERALLGVGDDAALAKLGAAVKARFVISLQVTTMPTQTVFTALALNTSTARAVARKTAPAGQGEAVLDAVEPFVLAFVSSLAGVDGMEEGRCPVWAGTARFRSTITSGGTSTREATGYGKGQVTSSTSLNKTTELSLCVDPEGRCQSQATYSELSTGTEERTGKILCGGNRMSQPTQWRDWNRKEVSTIRFDAAGPLKPATVQLRDGKLHLSMPYVEIEGMQTLEITGHSDGTCGKPENLNKSFPATRRKFTRSANSIALPFQPRQDTQSGQLTLTSIEDKSGSHIETIEWNLTNVSKAKGGAK